MKADLHLHTHYSDGTDSPDEVVARAARGRFDVIAVTDHDTVNGLPEALDAGRQLGVKVVPGVEITAQWNQCELHLLAYFSPKDDGRRGWRNSDLNEQLKLFMRYRSDRGTRIVERLNALGIALTLEDVRRQAGKGVVGRPHIAAALVARGRVSGMDQAFNEFLKRGRPAWVDKPRIDARDAIQLVHGAGGVIVLAHPGLISDTGIPLQLFAQGLDGLEVYHSRHSPSQSARFLDLVRQHHRLGTGGSDCHGMLKGEPLMGRVQFSGEDLDRFLERLKCNGTIGNER